MSISQDPEFRGGRNGVRSEAETRLCEQVPLGGVLDLAGQTVRGAVLREALCGCRADNHELEAGLRIVNGIVAGGLNLESVSLVAPVVFERMRFEGDESGGAIVLRDARIKRFALHESVVEGAVFADRVHAENGVFITACEVAKAIELCGADIGGTVTLDNSRFGDGARGLVADGARVRGRLALRNSKVRGVVSLLRAFVDGGVFGDGAVVAGGGAEWGVNAAGVRLAGDCVLTGCAVEGGLNISQGDIGGRIVLDGIKLASGRETAIEAAGVNVEHGVSAGFATVRGAVVLRTARLAKDLSTPGLDVSGGEIAIDADGVMIGGNWDLAGAKLVGDVSLAGARIDGQLRLREARLYGGTVAMRADGARINGGCYFSRAIVIGLLRFPAAHLGNQFRLRGASLKADFGPALIANGTVFCRDVELNGGMVSAGAIVLDQADIRGTLDLSDGQLTSAALARVGVGAGSGSGAEGDAQDPMSEDYDEVALSFVDGHAGRVMMPDREDHRPRGIVNLSRANVGAYHDFAATWPPQSEERARTFDGRDLDHLVLDGFTYDHLSNPSGAQSAPGKHSHADDRVGARRMVWLSGQEVCDIRDHFKPQPWVQLSQRLAAQGYDEDARAISITRQRLALSSHSVGFVQRWQGRILDLFALFGHNPWRTLVWMIFFVVAFAGLWTVAAGWCQQQGCRDESVFVVTNRDAYSPDTFKDNYPAFNAFGYSLDTFVPFVSFGYADHWRPNVSYGPLRELEVPSFLGEPIRYESGARPDPGGSSSNRAPITISITIGGLLYLMMVVEILIGVALISLAVTGFTGVLRSD